MNLSMKKVLDILNETEGDITLNQLGFILTVIRDNVTDDDVYNVLDRVIKENIK